MPFADALTVHPGSKVDLSRVDPGSTPGYAKSDKDRAKAELDRLALKLETLQTTLWAEDRRGVLIVLQGMDTSGKDGTIRAVLNGLSPLGVRVTPFKVPSAEELDHDFLWRVHKAVPPKGEFGIFNRSHYEDVLVVRVNKLVPDAVWKARYDQINAFERLLADTGTVIFKFFLHISKGEQKKRLEERLADPVKRWKFSPGDLEQRQLWPEYQRAYEDALRRCSTPYAPWFIIPADRKWYRNIAVARTLVEGLERLKPRVPKPSWNPKTIKIV